jgi:hypothetical protein
VDAAALEKLAARLLENAGTTYAEDAVIRLADKPMRRFELLTLCTLSSKPIDVATGTDELGAVARNRSVKLAAAPVKVSLDDRLRDAG